MYGDYQTISNLYVIQLKLKHISNAFAMSIYVFDMGKYGIEEYNTIFWRERARERESRFLIKN